MEQINRVGKFLVEKRLMLLAVLSFFLFTVHVLVAGHGIYGDGNAYYSYAQALYFEKSLDFDPIYAHLSQFQGKKYIFSRIFWNTDYGPFGIRRNPYFIGTGILWIPALLVTDLLVKIFNPGVDRFSIIYELGSGFTGVMFVVLGLYFTEKWLENFFKRDIIRWSSVILIFATFVLYYCAFEPALSQQPSFFLISYLLYKTYALSKNKYSFFTIGLISGVLAMTRLSDVIFLLPVIYQLAKQRMKLYQVLSLAFGALLGFLPQLLSQLLMHGNLFHNSYLSGENGYFTLSLKQLWMFLFSAERGLFIWTPAFLLSFLGLFRALREKNPGKQKTAFWGLLSVLGMVLVASSWWSYIMPGYSQRFLFAAIPYLAFGFCYLFGKISRKKIVAAVTVFTIWNLLLLIQFYYDSERLVRSVGINYQNLLLSQFTTPFNILQMVREKGFAKFIFDQVLD